MDYWQQRCNTQDMEITRSLRAAPIMASCSLKQDYSWRTDLSDPRVVESRKRTKLHFRKTCRVLDKEGLEVWQQQRRANTRSLSVRTWRKTRKPASRQELHNGNAAQLSCRKSCKLPATVSLELWQQRERATIGCHSVQTLGEFQKTAWNQNVCNGGVAQVNGCPTEQVLRICTSENVPTFLSIPSSTSCSNAAAASPAVELVKQDRLHKMEYGATSAASFSSIANTRAHLVPLRQSRWSTGRDNASSVEQTVSHSDCHSSLERNLMAAKHFDISAGDVDEEEDAFFPEERPVIDCS